jgi:ATP-dependent helicase/nuclease subunit A
MNQITDYQQRQLALDVSKSFIVQAPAGSGKTTLLVKRYLALLATAKAPESIIAITFTRKAAGEMRNRIINALTKPITSDPELNSLATKVLEQDQKENWQLLKNPKRLRIQTIDSLLHFLVQQMPLFSRLPVNFAMASEQEAEQYYIDAARALLSQINNSDIAVDLKKVLLYLANDWQLAEKLFCAMLRKREQWLPYIVSLRHKNGDKLRQAMESGLAIVTQECIEKCVRLMPHHLHEELGDLLHLAHQNLRNTDDNFLHPFNYKHFTDTTFPGSSKFWRGVSQLLLTKEYSWRAKVNKNHGFPDKEVRQRMHDLLEKFQEHEEFRQTLEDMLRAPTAKYTDEQWEIIQALLTLLPLLAAHLKLIFNENNVYDYAEILMAADRALGENDSPTDLALKLDYKIQHLLIDEFQDTSLAQFRVIEKLLTGWAQESDRTVFIVGDPMQSIYRFREADVGLFLRAQQNGIARLKLHPLTLTTNFRSSNSLITWINTNLHKIFPVLPDITFGAIPFHPSTANNHDNAHAVFHQLLVNTDDNFEAKHVITTIQELKISHPDDTIAILVRSRTALAALIPALRTQQIAFQATELEPLRESMIIQDLVSLTRALLHPADRTAWLALLRAPWCGLKLEDLHRIANGEHPIIWDNICEYQQLNLSADGQSRVAHLHNILQHQLANQGKKPLHGLVRTTWQMLNGAATALTEHELENAELFFQLLAKNNTNLEQLASAIDSLYGSAPSLAKLQIMTIHKAKGLEFDHVIIPGIDKPPRADSKKLLMWLERPRLQGGSDLLLAPITPHGADDDSSIYQYLQVVANEKNQNEIARLLYVAITRAKKTVHLFGKLAMENPGVDFRDRLSSKSFADLLKSCMDNTWLNLVTPELTAIAVSKHLPLRRFTSSQFVSLDNSEQTPSGIDFSFDYDLLDKNEQQLIGTAIHRVLETIATQGLKKWTVDFAHSQAAYYRRILLELGAVNLEHDLAIISAAIANTLNDKQGRWILDDHEDAHSELALSGMINNKVENCIIDRTFVENGVRWIIDFKTSKYELEVQQLQLQKYAQLMHHFDPHHPIKTTLYFPQITR